MLTQAAEQSFQQGVSALTDGRRREALAYFNGAIEIERRVTGSRTQARYLSYYGLSLALNSGNLHESVRCCRAAAKLERYRPDLCWNLGRVLLMANRRREAHRAFKWGLRMQPDHEGIRTDLQRMGNRRRPILPFLHRANSINVFLGRILRAS